MPATAYDILKDKVADAFSKWEARKAELAAQVLARSKDGGYQYRAERISAIDSTANANGGVAMKTGKGNNAKWYGRYDVYIDSGNPGVMWYDGSTPAANKEARDYIRQFDEGVSAKQNAVDSAKKYYDETQKNLTTYETTSPVAKATIANATADANLKTALTILGIVLILGIVIGAIVWYNRNKRKGAAPAAAAA